MNDTPPSPLEIASNPLMQAMRRVIKAAEGSKLAPDRLAQMAPDLAVIAEIMELTNTQALLFALFVEMSDSNEIRLTEISKYVGCQHIDLVAMMNDIDVLHQRQLIRVRKLAYICYRVPQRVLNKVKCGHNFIPQSIEGLSNDEFFKRALMQFTHYHQGELSSEELVEMSQRLIDCNPHLTFCRVLQAYTQQTLLSRAVVILLAVSLIEEGRRQLPVDYIIHIFADASGALKLRNGLRRGHYPLYKEGIIEYGYASGLVDRSSVRLTRMACEMLFAEVEVDLEERGQQSQKNFKLHGEITAKRLFYNERETHQIETLTSLLEPGHFAETRERLQQSGMRTGFAVLFFGTPGTGKTETAYQLARQTGRDIMTVNIADTKSMWFGESEKLIKGIFDNYRKEMKRRDVAPILLFNEADAILSKRQQVENNHLAQTENAMQNILLQELENLDGILIATTNLTHNLDKAFERRFLYKIEFHKPELRVRKAIWQAMMPELSDKDTTSLASQYDFSGGQIENILRRHTVEHILHGTPQTLESIQKLCRTERIEGWTSIAAQRPIGF